MISSTCLYFNHIVSNRTLPSFVWHLLLLTPYVNQLPLHIGITNFDYAVKRCSAMHWWTNFCCCCPVQCCGSGCLSWIPNPDFYPFRISDPGSSNSNSNKRGGKKQIFPTHFSALNFTKFIILLFLNRQ